MKGFEGEIGDVYICILFDLMLYNYPELNNAAFELIVRFFNRKATLLECLGNIQILESTKSIDILNKVKVFKQQLAVQVKESDYYMSQSDKNARENKKRVGEIMSFLAAYCTATEAQKRDNVGQAASKLQSLFGVKNPDAV